LDGTVLLGSFILPFCAAKNFMSVISVTLALPPVALHAHNTGGWRSKAGPTKAYREESALLTQQAMRKKRGSYPYENAELSIDFYFPNLKRRDTLNAVQGLKPAIDGLSDAGLIVDDDWKHLSIGNIRSYLDRENPRVCLKITRNKSQNGEAGS
jgi:Holliday junction resolvase RusA-like endonuclease|tara:strand:+ start:28 stop:489 length:462 start_codon:yes stop_codon:yes gene_type:complete